MSVATSSLALDVMPLGGMCTFAKVGRATRFPSSFTTNFPFPDPHTVVGLTHSFGYLTGYHSQVATGM